MFDLALKKNQAKIIFNWGSINHANNW